MKKTRIQIEILMIIEIIPNPRFVTKNEGFLLFREILPSSG